MNNNKILFPFYFKTNDGLFCHTVSNHCYDDNGKIIGIPKYFPADGNIDNGRIIDGKLYFDHMPTFGHSINRTRQKYQKYMNYVKYYGEEMCTFDSSDISIIFDPRNTVKSIYNDHEKYNNKIHSDARKLIESINSILDIPLADIGIEGSLMLNCYKNNSDIDVVIFGEKSIYKLLNSFDNLGRLPDIHLYDMGDIDLIYSRRYKYESFDTNEELLAQEKKRTVGLINGRRFWLQPVLEDDFIFEKRNYNLARIDLIEDVFFVKNGIQGTTWPAFYEIENKKYGSIYMECYDPIYMNQASTGDKILVRGFLYGAIDKNDNKKVVILAPWIETKQYLRKI